MSGPEPPAPLDRLVGETRARREELHLFIERLRRDRDEWASRAESLLRRRRLTAAQRQLFRVYLSRFKARQRP